MDPMTASALIGAGSNILGKAMTPPPSAGPSTALGSSNGTGGASGGGLDFSGFTVALNGSNATGAPNNKVSGFALTPTMMIIAAVIVILVIKELKS